MPSFLCKFMKSGDGFIGWNNSAEKMISSEPKIKDVCATCNNNALSTLDNQAKILFESSGVLVENYTKNLISMKFEYDILFRWLLKVSYNSSRQEEKYSHLFYPYKKYILGSDSRPKKNEISLIVKHLKPIKATDAEFGGALKDIKLAENGLFNPFIVRTSWAIFSHPSPNFNVRLNIFGPLAFYMIFFEKNTLPGHAASIKRKFLSKNQGAIDITNKNYFRIQAGSESWLENYTPQIIKQELLSNRNC